MTLLFLTDMSVTRCLCHGENSWKHFTVLVKEIDAFLSDNENDRAEELLWLFYRDDVKAIEYVEVKHPLLKELIANPTRDKVLEIIKQLNINRIDEVAEYIKDTKLKVRDSDWYLGQFKHEEESESELSDWQKQ